MSSALFVEYDRLLAAQKWLEQITTTVGDHEAVLRRALVAYEAAIDWTADMGEYHFCSFDSDANRLHGNDCPLAHLNQP